MERRIKINEISSLSVKRTTNFYNLDQIIIGVSWEPIDRGKYDYNTVSFPPRLIDELIEALKEAKEDE